MRQPIEELLRYDWPGNIRELRNVMERAIILSMGGTIKLPNDTVSIVEQHSIPAKFPTLSENERQHIADAIRRCNGTIGGPKGAASLLDINVNTLRSKMENLACVILQQTRLVYAFQAVNAISLVLQSLVFHERREVSVVCCRR